MSADGVLDATRFGLLTLAFMMLLSRAAFQLAGPIRMRSFLDAWQRGRVKRLWGVLGLGYAAFLSTVGPPVLDDLSALDVVLLVALWAILLVDGLLNVLPAGFETFKARLQERWIERRRGTGREGDRHLFATVNLLLALAAAGTAGFVISYRPISAAIVALAAGIAVVLTFGLIGTSALERR